MPELSFLIRPLGPLMAHTGMAQTPILPDSLRLFDALAASAWATGMTPQRREALEWLEAHPPTSLQHPQSIYNEAPWAFRDRGEYQSKGRDGYTSPKKKVRSDDLISCSGALGWGYGEAPASVIKTLSDLASNVAYLGESRSRVTVDVEPIVATHTARFQRAAFGAMPRDAFRQSCPCPGRLEGLEDSYAATRSDKLVRDALTASEKVEQEVFLGRGTIIATPVRPRLADVPWTYGWAFITQHPIPATERVTWAAAMHRTIAARVGGDVPSFVSGHFEGKQPANHVTIQYVEGPSADPALRYGSLVIAAPTDMPADERIVLEHALEDIGKIFDRGRSLALSYHGPIDPSLLWDPIAPGYRRSWITDVPMVAEIQRPASASSWHPEDAVDVSLGFVLRSRLRLRNVGPSRMAQETISQVHKLGLFTECAEVVADSETEHFAHTMRSGMPCVALSATIRDDGGLGSQALCAIGQARHFGGGLLRPLDERIEA